MYLRLITATVGVSISLFLLFYILGIRRGLKIDWDGLTERLFIVIFFSAGGMGFYLIPLIILIRIYYYLNARGNLWFARNNEPAVEMQKAKFKTEMVMDLALSPALAILVCLIL
ncbi:MAG: hypothetical protein WC624_02570 [Candidatus Margulisiibacteriota bacterium]